MKKYEDLCMGITSLNLTNYWRRMVLSVSIIEIFNWNIEIFQFLNGISPQIMNKVFQVKLPALNYI